MYLHTAAEFVKEFRRTGEQEGPLVRMASEDAPVGIVDALDVGALAARLLAEGDVTSHDKASYVVNGPEDITRWQIVAMVEREIGAKLEPVRFKDVSFIDYMADQAQGPKSVILSIKHAPETAWEGKCAASTTSLEVLRLAALKVTPSEAFEAMI